MPVWTSWTSTGGGAAADAGAAMARPASTAMRDAGRHMGRDFTPVSRIERLDLGPVFVRDRTALELHRRGQLVAAGQPLLLEQRPALDLLHPRQGGVGLVDLLPHAGENAGVGRVQARLGVEHEQRDVVGAAIADDARLADER